MTALEYRQEMKKVMDYAIQEKTIDGLSDEQALILFHCFEEEYIEGLIMIRMISGRVVAEVRHDPAYTLKGLEFLDELKKELGHANMHIPKLFKATWKNVATMAGGIAVAAGFIADLLGIIQGREFIVSILSALFS